MAVKATLERLFLACLCVSCWIIGILSTGEDATNGNTQEGPVFTLQPDENVEFSNNTGTTLRCVAKGFPQPIIKWILADGSPLSPVHGLRQVTPDGTLVFLPFKAEDYRQDVHAVAYKCLASNTIGIIVTRDIKPKAVIEQIYDVYVYDSFVIKANTGIMKCHVPAFLSKYIRVISWLRDDRYVINNTDFHQENKYVVAPNGDLYIRDVDSNDQSSTYRCQIIHRLTNSTKMSSYQGKLIVADSNPNVGPRFVTQETQVTALEGTNVIIPCSAQATPPPTIKWFRKIGESVQSINDKQTAGILIINASRIGDSGRYVCEAENLVKKESMEVTITIQGRLKVSVAPKKIVADVGTSVTIFCNISGLPVVSAVWLKNGKVVSSEEAISTPNSLTIAAVTPSHKGMYQCMAKSDSSSAYDVAQLTLGDTPPEFVSVFDEQILQPLASLSLKCVVSGSPLPSISWMLDNTPMSTKLKLGNKPISHNRPGDANGLVVSWLNVSEVQAENGGVYTCAASNKVGSIQHSAKINVYGSLASRAQSKISAIASRDVSIFCPVYGYPIDTITWHRDKVPLPQDRRQRVRKNGTLIITNVQSSSDSGIYVCTVNGKNQETKGSVDLTIMVPPKITPFFFQEDLLREGMRARLQCVISEGDLPMTIQWTKDGHPISGNSGVAIRDLDDYSSILTISSVTPRQNGKYTCTAKNDAAATSHTAILSVNVPPKIIPFAFQDDQFFKGMRAHIICAVNQGDLPINFNWLKDGERISSILGITTRNYDDYTSSLSIESVSSMHTGNYSCIASNRAATVFHTAQLLVYVAPKITPFSFQEASRMEGSFARITCLVYQGDLPINLTWLKDNAAIPSDLNVITKTIDDYSSILTIENVNTRHTGNYTCAASNAAATIHYSTELIVYVPPKIVPFTFQDDYLLEGMLARVSCVVSRGDLPLKISWLKDGQPIPNHLSVTVRDFDEYSNVLSIDPLTISHTGNYTCIVENHAGTVTQSAILTVNVPPRWIEKPVNKIILLNEEITLNCKADGFPSPTITWKKVVGKDLDGEEEKINADFNTDILANGTLKIRQVTLNQEGFYICYVFNGIGVELSAMASIKVQAPVYFKIKETAAIQVIGESVVLKCVAFGDGPIYFQWVFTDQLITESHDARYKIQNFNNTEEKSSVSELQISSLTRSDEGRYSCLARNAYGRANQTLLLTIKVPPASPEIMALRNLGNRSVEISWSKPYDGHSPVTQYTLQYKRKQDSWSSRTITLSFDSGTTTAVIRDLNAATIYEFRVLAENDVGIGDASDVMTVVLGEEAPEGAPQQLDVEAVDPQTLRVSWKPPKKNLWNGVIRGYYVGYKVHGSSNPYTFTELEVPEDYVEDLIYQLTNLNMYTQYSIVVQAYNSGGRGPSTDEIIVMTSEDIPSEPPQGVRCSSLSSHSIYVIWDPPPKDSIHGILRGYKVLYKPAEEWYDGSPKTNITAASKVTLVGLEVDTNYSIQVLAFTKLGDGSGSEPVYCKTYEDVPGSPDAVKALPSSEDSILVSWKPPSKPNGAITKYNVYYTLLENGEEHKDFSNTDKLQGVNFQTLDSESKYFEVKGLNKDKRYAFWVTALSAIGEGPISSVMTQLPAGRSVPAKSASFDDVLKTHWKKDIALPCRAVGVPIPERKWLFQGKPVLQSDRFFIRFDGTLVIKKSEQSDNGNYSCKVSNKFGSDEVHYKITVHVPPGTPILDVLSKSLTSVRLNWRNSFDGGEPVQGYVLHFKRDTSQWEKKTLPAETHTYTLENLACGATYQLYLEAVNTVGVGNPCEVVTVTTNGEIFQLPQKEALVEEGITFVTVHFDSWPSTGCPIEHFVAEYKSLESSDWILVSNNIKPNQKKFVISGLSPATWYVLRLTAYTNRDDFNIGEYIFATLTVYGATITPDVIRTEEKIILFYLDPWIFIPVVVLLIIGIITAVVVFIYCKRKVPRHRKAPEEPVDWTQYMGTLAQSHRELGVSVESFVRMPKGANAATLHRHQGTLWRGNEPNPYATIRLPGCCSEMTLMRDRRMMTNPQQIPMQHDGWVQVLPANATGMIQAAKANLAQTRWPEGTYGPVVGVAGDKAIYNVEARSPQVKPAQETTFTFPNEGKSTLTQPEIEKPDEVPIRKDGEVQEDAWLLNQQ